MDSLYVGFRQIYIDLVSPLDISTGGHQGNYVQKIERDRQNFYITGHYWYELFGVKYAGGLATDQ